MSCVLCQNLIIKDNGEGGSAGGLAGKLRSLNAQHEGAGLLIESLAAVSKPVSANQFLAEARLLEWTLPTLYCLTFYGLFHMERPTIVIKSQASFTYSSR